MVRLPRPAYIKTLKKGAKILFVVEALLFAGSYGVWQRMNTNRGRRLHFTIDTIFIISFFQISGIT